VGLTGCNQSISPKPKAYHRIAFPQKSYTHLSKAYPFTCQIPSYAEVSAYAGDQERIQSGDNWLNVDFPEYNAHIHLTYKQVSNNLAKLIEDAHTFVYKHTVKAESIVQTRFENPKTQVYGVYYRIKGNTASGIQFFCTDSISNFLRGALYIDSEPNKDSLAPVIDFLAQDTKMIMETLVWQNPAQQ